MHSQVKRRERGRGLGGQGASVPTRHVPQTGVYLLEHVQAHGYMCVHMYTCTPVYGCTGKPRPSGPQRLVHPCASATMFALCVYAYTPIYTPTHVYKSVSVPAGMCTPMPVHARPHLHRHHAAVFIRAPQESLCVHTQPCMFSEHTRGRVASTHQAHEHCSRAC